MPTFNKILENEYLRLYNLKESLGGRLIKVKTDAVVVKGKHNNIKLSKKDIIKHFITDYNNQMEMTSASNGMKTSQSKTKSKR